MVRIDGEVVVSASGSFPEGSFGFYNYSQSDVRYSGFRQTGDDPDIAPGDPGVSRVDGMGSGDPIDTAAEICQFLVPDGTGDAVALARIDDFADALTGSALPVDCILFTEGGPDAPLDPDTQSEIGRALGEDGTVYVLGGVNAVHATSTPIVLTTTDVLHPTADRVTQAVVDATPGAEVVVIGDIGFISDAVATAVGDSVGA